MNNTVKTRIPEFYESAANFPVKRLKHKMLELCEEELQYAADELLLLSEEILNQVSAFGVCLYLKNGGEKQTEKHNDYVLHELFLNHNHQNAGPIFYQVREMVADIRSQISNNYLQIFDKTEGICRDLQNLAEFRNALMHGFFVLPAEKNKDYIIKVLVILKKLQHLGIFEYKANYHFRNEDGFSGKWYIGEEDGNAWLTLAGSGDSKFEKLATLANRELQEIHVSHSVIRERSESIPSDHSDAIENFIAPLNQPAVNESLYVTFHPADETDQSHFFENAFSILKNNNHVECIAYNIDSDGIMYTSYYLIKAICSKLNISIPKKDTTKKLASAINSLHKEKNKNLVILINNIHLAPFASDHITTMMKLFRECNIWFIGVGHEYEHLNSLFSMREDFRKGKNIIPNQGQTDQLIHNHTRHRGPFENDPEFAGLKQMIRHICRRLEDKKPVIARKLAGELHTDIELVNEAIYILYPYVKYSQSGDESNYEKDKVHDLYGFPETQTETTSTFLALGRRDIDLEYKHKIMMP